MPGKLVILRGPSGSGKTSVATAVRECASTPTALIGQDHIRRLILKERENAGSHNLELISQIATFAKNHGYNVILEGIFTKHRYESMLQNLMKQFATTYLYYFDIPFDETLRRHATKPNADEYGEAEMREWYTPHDVLGLNQEIVIPALSNFDETVELICRQTKL